MHLVGFIIRMFVGYPPPPSHFVTLLHFSHDQSNWSSASFSSTTFYKKQICGKWREKRNNSFLNSNESFVFYLLIYSKCLYVYIYIYILLVCTVLTRLPKEGLSPWFLMPQLIGLAMKFVSIIFFPVTKKEKWDLHSAIGDRGSTVVKALR